MDHPTPLPEPTPPAGGGKADGAGRGAETTAPAARESLGRAPPVRRLDAVGRGRKGGGACLTLLASLSSLDKHPTVGYGADHPLHLLLPSRVKAPCPALHSCTPAARPWGQGGEDTAEHRDDMLNVDARDEFW